MPEKSHANRDFSNILKIIRDGNTLSPKLYIMYAKELYIAGDDTDFLESREYFEWSFENEIRGIEELKAGQCILVKCARLMKDSDLLLKNSLKNLADGKASAEVCYEVGEYFFERGDYLESAIWFYNAAFETTCELNIHYAGDYPLKRLSEVYHLIGNEELETQYSKMLQEWELPTSPDA
jgi:hypothetical protein